LEYSATGQEISDLFVSIFIRARNEEVHIDHCLRNIFSQRTEHDFEVILLDCSSTDRTVELAKRYPLKIFSIPPEHFSYSGALNFGVRVASGDFFVPLSAHSVPFDENWLDGLLRKIARDSSIGASYSRQIPWDDSCLAERRWLSIQFPEEDRLLSPDDFQQAVANGLEPYEELRFSNSSSCIRRELADRLQFRSVPYAEDRAFALDCLQSGLAIHYASESVVVHSHSPSFTGFMRVAERATIARAMVNALALDTKASERMLDFSGSWLRRQLLLPGSVTYCLLKIIGALANPSETNKKRAVSYHLSSVGTTIGKIRGRRQIKMREPNEKIPIARPDAIRSSAVKLQ
jgi:GT2 family glycosyltransferase